MKLTLVCTFLLAAAAPAFADSHCPPGQLNVWGACVDPVGPGVFERDRGYRYDHGRRDHWDRGYHRGHRHGHDRNHWHGGHGHH